MKKKKTLTARQCIGNLKDQVVIHHFEDKLTHILLADLWKHHKTNFLKANEILQSFHKMVMMQ